MKKLALPITIAVIVLVGYLIFRAKPVDNVFNTQSPPPSLSQPTPTTTNTSDWKVYRNVGIEFKYPSHWSISENLYDHPAAVFPAGEIRLTGDGYIFAINPNEGFGEFPPDQYQSIKVEVNNTIIDGVETIDNLIHKYFLGFSINRPNSNEYYFFRLSGSLNMGKDISEIKKMIMEFVKTIKII